MSGAIIATIGTAFLVWPLTYIARDPGLHSSHVRFDFRESPRALRDEVAHI